MNKINEECGVFGIISPEARDVAHSVYYGLFALQHRGQQSCGISVNNGGVFHTCKDEGLVEQVFTEERLLELGEGTMAVGQVLYGTSGMSSRTDAQPMVVTHIKGKMALANNGSLVNSAELREELELGGAIFNTDSDAEVIAYLITRERLNTDTIEQAIENIMPKLQGAYAVVIMTQDKLVAMRDMNGFKPLCYGRTADGEYVIASESCALDSVGARFVRDIEPGEIISVDCGKITSNRKYCGGKHSQCIFEFIYFARPDSVIDGVSVHAARMRAGAELAAEYPVEADVVVGVPDSGIDAAIGYAKYSGIPYGLGFIKNKYIGRTFIAPGQKNREDKVKIKLNPVSETVRGKRVVLIDDSIVRGTTSAKIVKLLRGAGAVEVHLRISSPPFINPCYYGTDIDSKEVLIACKHSTEEIRKIVGVDSLGYLSLHAVPRIAEGGKCNGYCTACFDGKYSTDIPKNCKGGIKK